MALSRKALRKLVVAALAAAADPAGRGLSAKAARKRVLETLGNGAGEDGRQAVDACIAAGSKRFALSAGRVRLLPRDDAAVEHADAEPATEAGIGAGRGGVGDSGARAAAASPKKKKAKKAKAAAREAVADDDDAEQAALDEEMRPKAAEFPADADDDDAESDGAAAAAPAGAWTRTGDGRPPKRGRFSPDEKAAFLAALTQHASSRGLSLAPDGASGGPAWLFRSRSGRSTAGRAVWLELASSLPRRTPRQVQAMGTRLVHDGNYKGAWGVEEDAGLRQAVARHGDGAWAAVGGELGRLPESCRDRWRLLGGSKGRATGAWTAAESEALGAAVRRALDTRGGLITGSRASNPMVLDDLPWGTLATEAGVRRTPHQCMEHWYRVLSPPMAAAGTWGPGDDVALLASLVASGAEEPESVDWGKVVAGRPGAASRRRWKLMTKAVPAAVDKGFGGCVAYLAERYAPELLGGGGEDGEGGGEEEGEEEEGPGEESD